MEQLLEIDTQGTCLLCLKTCDDNLQTENLGKESADVRVSSTRLKLLLRFLEIDVSKLTEKTEQGGRPGSFHFLEHDGGAPPTTMELGATTCDTCSSIMNDFSELFQNFEKLRLRLLECVGTVHDLIKEGEGDEERVREFRRRKITASTQRSRGEEKRGNPDLLTINVESLRRETLEKCALRILRKKQSIPQVVVKRYSLNEDSAGGNSPSHAAEEDQDLNDEDEEQLIQEVLLTDDDEEDEVDKDDEEDEVDKDDEEEVTPVEEINPSSSSTNVYRITHPLNKTVSYGEPDSNNHVTIHRCRSCPEVFFHVETLLKHEESCHSHSHSAGDRATLEFSAGYGKLSCVRSSSTRSQPHNPNPAKKSKPDIPPPQKERNFMTKNSTSIRLLDGRCKCSLCEQQFATRLSFNEHYKDQHKDKCFKCSFCGQLILHRNRYEAHLLLAHPLQSTRLELPKHTTAQQLKKVLAAICKERRPISSSSSSYGCPVCPSVISDRNVKLHLLQCHVDEIAKGLTTLHEGINAKKWASRESECYLCSKHVDNLQLHMMAEHPSETLCGRLPPHTSEQDLDAALKKMNVGRDILWKGGRQKRKHQSCPYCDRAFIYATLKTELTKHIFMKHFEQVLKTLKEIKHNSSPAIPDPVQPMQVEDCPKPVKEVSQPTIIQQPQANEPKLKSVLRSLSSFLSISNSSSLNKCPHCGTLFPFKSSLNAHLTSAHPFQLYFKRLPVGTSENDFDKAINHLLDQPQADSFLSEQLGCGICASSPVPLIAAQTFPDRSYLKRHLLGKHLDKIIERLSEVENEIRDEVPLPLEVKVKIEECDMAEVEVKVEENEDLTIHPEQDPLAM